MCELMIEGMFRVGAFNTASKCVKEVACYGGDFLRALFRSGQSDAFILGRY